MSDTRNWFRRNIPFLDASRYSPFRTFNSYYINYSSVFGAIWVPGVITLLVIYGGSEFRAWTQVSDNQDYSFSPIDSSLSISLDQVGVAIYLNDGGKPAAAPFLNTSFYNVTFARCTTTSNSKTCVTVPTVPCLRGFCPYSTLNASSYLQGASTSASQTTVEVRIQTCQSPYVYVNPMTNVATNIACESSSNIQSMLKGSQILFNSGNNVPRAVLLKKSQLEFNSTYFLPISVANEYRASIYYQAQRVIILPSYFDDHIDDTYMQAYDISSGYSAQTSPGRIATLTLQLDAQVKTTRFIPITLLTIIAKFGALIAAIAIANTLVRFINFHSFFIQAKEDWFVPDVSTRRFLLANRSTEGPEFENQLVYACSFGGVDRFGLQLRHVYQHFSDYDTRFNRKSAQRVFDDILQFTSEKRIASFTSEERKMDRQVVEREYDVHKLDENVKEIAARESGFGDQVTEDLDPDLLAERENQVREVETALRLSVVYEELSKMKQIAARLYPVQAKKFRLAEKLADVAFSIDSDVKKEDND